MSTVIIITPPKKPPALVAESDGSASLVDESGVTVATFKNADQAIAYLKSIKKLEGMEE